jgi:urease accessory protein
MRRAVAVVPARCWPAPEETGTVTLPFHERHRRRVRLSDDQGEPFLLDLPHATLLSDGDGLALEGGGFVKVRAAREAVADLRCGSLAHVARVAWHIGNRHVPLQVMAGGTLRILDDHVLVEMAQGLGARIVRRRAPFAPEAGAYAGDGHAHAHGHSHSHPDTRERDHETDHGNDHGHGHGRHP